MACCTRPGSVRRTRNPRRASWSARWSASSTRLDGAGYAQNAAVVGDDSRLSNTLIGIHDYTFFVSPPYTSETQWANHLAGEIGGYASRTVVTEWGAPMSPGTKNGAYYNTIDYDVPGANYFDDYVRGISSELCTLGVGSVGSTANGANAQQSACASGDDDQEWTVVADGRYVRIQNRATGLFLDGFGSTSNGSVVGQWSDTNSDNQQWTVTTDGSNVRIVDRATSLYVDGMGRAAAGSALGQWSNTNSNNQQWSMVAAN
jgi:hypothetical protein